ncbi:hypothetical protein U9M48_019088 [Paspalum notatum var. saurae]|uniref:Reverse transcriptase zinc-binding domain-containing protein n=1 Tax=Paspalum notatum var. saurae TaxID=547442 RepID=A0AAQ3TE81_PASNO
MEEIAWYHGNGYNGLWSWEVWEYTTSKSLIDGSMEKKAELAASLFKAIPKKAIKSQTLAHTLHNRAWVSNISGALTVQVLVDYLLVWDLVEGVVLQQDVPDQNQWKLTQSSCYSSKSAYSAFFMGSVKFGSLKGIWKSWAPLKGKFFIWLVKNNSC